MSWDNDVADDTYMENYSTVEHIMLHDTHMTFAGGYAEAWSTNDIMIR